jgi:DNA-3-methyladenine glycosylase
MSYLTPSFFRRDVLTVARELVGMELLWQGCSGIIVETEAYAVADDPACHTATRPSSRAFVQSMPAGTAYVYFNYGMHWMLNVLVKGGERDGLILIRALEPLTGIEQMQARRGRERLQDLCSGPGKLASALGVHGLHHGLCLAGRQRPGDIGLRPSSRFQVEEVVADVRVGISRAAAFPWRFLAKANAHVSVPLGRVKPHKGGQAS